MSERSAFWLTVTLLSMLFTVLIVASQGEPVMEVDVPQTTIIDIHVPDSITRDK